MSDKIRITTSGIRGKVPEGLNVSVVSDFTSAYATYLEKGEIAVITDGRWSGKMFAHSVISSLSSSGLDISFLGVLPTPVVQFFLRKDLFNAAISITGGHNSENWNALLLLNRDGSYPDFIEGKEIFNIYHSKDFKKVSWNQLGKIKKIEADIDRYIEAIGEIVNTEEIRKSRFKIVIDSCGSSPVKIADKFARFFNIDLIHLNDKIIGKFPHKPEPSPENSYQTEATVKATSSDIGFLFNSDGSRLSVVDERGKGLSEEFTLPLVTLSYIKKINSPIITTVATSKIIELIGKEFNMPVLRTKVGQPSVIHFMRAKNSEIGGEGSGSVCISNLSFGYDSFISLALILQLMAETGKSISDIVKKYDKFIMKKTKKFIPLEKSYKVLHLLEEKYEKFSPVNIDGIRVEKKGVWFNIRPSTTEFALRIIIEAEDEQILENSYGEIEDILEGY
jgi:phosphomannomutase